MATKRRTIWARSNTGAVIGLAAVGVAAVNLSTLVEADRPGLGEYTIIRMIGNLFLSANTASVVSQQVLAGITTTSKIQAVASTPDPFNEPHADWMWWRGGYIARADQNPGASLLNWDFDIRSQRKQRELERDFQLIVSNRSVATIAFGVHLSALLKL